MITQGVVTSFKSEILEGTHDVTTDTLKIALYTSAASLDNTTTAYTTTAEVSASGYTAGGQTLTGVTVNTQGSVAFIGFNAATWSGAFTARGALIYNSSKGNKAVAVLDFGSDKTSSTTFLVTFPSNTYTDAIIRLC